MPEGCILYPARILSQGKVGYFNYPLAKEMGLIGQNHPHKMNSMLEKKLLNTFNLRIINEYDQEHKKKYPKNKIKEHPFMATRYLQLQHKNKQGATSGDGRGIWNGLLKNNGIEWDISSRGTGVTALAPGAVDANEPLESGNTDFGYGCGLAEIDELYSAALMSEIMHLNNYNTERVLLIIEHPKGLGIGVRAGKNLFRPAHLFNYLKQGNHDALTRSTDVFINRQIKNKEWDLKKNDPQKYNKVLDIITNDFAKFAAQLERDYIFAWLDWDGDNVLASAGIIDYGSIRQFGLRHDQYRYDDVERFSTNLNEQKIKTGQIIQTFCQMVDFLNTKKRKPLSHFSNHRNVKLYNDAFNYHLLDRLLYQLGFTSEQARLILLKQRKKVEVLLGAFETLEKRKTKTQETLIDGVNKPAILNLRKFSQLLPELISDKFSQPHTASDPTEVYESIVSYETDEKDYNITSAIKTNIQLAQDIYFQLTDFVCQHSDLSMKNLKSQLQERSNSINSPTRVTGNALIFVVNELFKKKRGGLSTEEIQKIMEKFIQDQCLNPDAQSKFHTQPKFSGKKSQDLIRTLFTILDGHSEDI